MTLCISRKICDSFVGTLLNTGKSKDTLKARLDLQDMNIRKNLQMKLNDGNILDKPPAEYVLTPPERRAFLEWLKTIKFPDGYAANI